MLHRFPAEGRRQVIQLARSGTKIAQLAEAGQPLPRSPQPRHPPGTVRKWVHHGRSPCRQAQGAASQPRALGSDPAAPTISSSTAELA